MPPVNLAADKVRRLPVDGATPQFVQFGVVIGSLDVAVAPVASLHAGAPRGGGRRRSRHLSGTSKSPLTARRARAPPLPLSPRPCHSCQKRIKAAVSRGDPEVGGSDRGRLAALAEGGASPLDGGARPSRPASGPGLLVAPPCTVTYSAPDGVGLSFSLGTSVKIGVLLVVRPPKGAARCDAAWTGRCAGARRPPCETPGRREPPPTSSVWRARSRGRGRRLSRRSEVGQRGGTLTTVGSAEVEGPRRSPPGVLAMV